MPNLKPDDDTLRRLLTQSKTVAIVGHSDKPERHSYLVGKFFKELGYTVYPVNPLVTEINGQPFYPTLQDIPEPVDIVNVFRNSKYLPEIVNEAIAINAKTIWSQLGIWDLPSAQIALDAGLNVVMDACIKIEYLRLGLSSVQDEN